MGSLCTDTAVNGWEGEVTADICGADAAACATVGCNVVGVDHVAGARHGIFLYNDHTTKPVKNERLHSYYIHQSYTSNVEQIIPYVFFI